jgi:hypothetical protein
MNNISKELAKKAKRLGICKEWHDRLKTTDDRRRMIEMYIKGIDFCLSNDYPGNEYIKSNFGDIIHDYGVFVDDNIDLKNIKRCVALGNTEGRIEITEYGVCEVFVKHNSRLAITAKDNAFIEVDVFDNSVINVSASDNARICINKYTGSAIEGMIQIDNAIIKINEKLKKSYKI